MLLKKKSLVIIVPVYNEEAQVAKTLNLILEKSKLRIVVIDDGSTDNSFEVLEKLFGKNKRIYLLRHVINLGKGAAMKTGVEFAWKLKFWGVIFIDADGQHDPKHLFEFENLLKKIPVVFGCRELNEKMPWIRKMGNLVALKLVGGLFGINRSDLLCGFMAIRRSVYKKIAWRSCRYGVETEMATKVARNKISFSEVKIDTIYLDAYKGVTILDALKILLNIPFWYFF